VYTKRFIYLIINQYQNI